MSAIQQERITRRKHDGSAHLSNRLPLDPALAAAGLRLADIDIIVSSFQSASPSGDGLGRRYVAPGFELFDPLDRRHFVISHHFSHAFHAAAASGMDRCAVLVCDLGGSTTVDGRDYALPFGEWHESMRRLDGSTAVKTECLSIYRWHRGTLELLDREFVVPHSSPELFVFSPASLYENVCAALFKGRPVYGELMALASFGKETLSPVSVSDIVDIRGGEVHWKNGWQRDVDVDIDNFEQAAAIARVVQSATELALAAYANRACLLAGSRNIAAAGGMFLNINTNSRIALAPECDRLFVPSAPHDAGISQGCALYGLHRASHPTAPVYREYRNDRVGPAAATATAPELAEFEGLISVARYSQEQVCDILLLDKVVARCAGRSEFGPRALGGRSLLASPFPASTKDVLNDIKGRQSWRPVAPIVVAERINDFFEGPAWSPFMNLLHRVRPCWRKKLAALEHADGSTRVQSLDRETDPELHDLLLRFGERSGAPVLVNTSLNGAGLPMVETGTEAVRLFLSRRQIDCLVLDDFVIRRLRPWSSEPLWQRALRLAPGTLAMLVRGRDGAEGKLSQGGHHREIGIELAGLLMALEPDEPLGSMLDRIGGRDHRIARDLYALLEDGLLETTIPTSRTNLRTAATEQSED